MQRILIVGCSGSGKTTLAGKLGSLLDLPVIHLDRLFWQPNWQMVNREVFDERLAEALAQPRWIIDGNFDRTLSLRLSKCDTAIALDYSRVVCLYGVAKRVLRHYGRTRPDMTEGCPEHVDWAFLQWIWAFNRDKRPGLIAAITQAAQNGVEVHTFKRRRQCRKWMRTLQAASPKP
jgi:adenylate kinase family enzyme